MFTKPIELSPNEANRLRPDDATIYGDVTEGTGRFEDATGTAVTTGSGDTVLQDHLTSAQSTAEIQIQLRN